MTKVTYDWKMNAMIWEKWFRDRKDPPFMDAMSMKRRDELLDRLRRKLEADEVPLKHWRARMKPRVTKAEMVRDLERLRSEEDRAVENVVGLFEELFGEKE